MEEEKERGWLVKILNRYCPYLCFDNNEYDGCGHNSRMKGDDRCSREKCPLTLKEE